MGFIKTDFRTFTEENVCRQALDGGRKHGLCICSDELWADAKERAAGEIAINVCYTDYGGTFVDKAMIAYMKK